MGSQMNLVKINQEPKFHTTGCFRGGGGSYYEKASLPKLCQEVQQNRKFR